MLDEWERSRGFKEAVGASYPGASALMLQSCNSEQVLDRERRLEVFANTGPSGLFRARPLPAQNGGEDRAVRNYPEVSLAPQFGDYILPPVGARHDEFGRFAFRALSGPGGRLSEGQGGSIAG